MEVGPTPHGVATVELLHRSLTVGTQSAIHTFPDLVLSKCKILLATLLQCTLCLHLCLPRSSCFADPGEPPLAQGLYAGTASMIVVGRLAALRTKRWRTA